MNKTLLLGAAFAAAISASPALAANSAFGCKHLEDNPTLPSVEGRDGFFYRIFADLRMQHPFTEDTVAQMGKLAEALKARGTTMLYVPIPTKSVTLPTFLPDEAKLFGFDEDVAVAVYEDQVKRLNAKGVITVDLLSALHASVSSRPLRDEKTREALASLAPTLVKLADQSACWQTVPRLEREVAMIEEALDLARR